MQQRGKGKLSQIPLGVTGTYMTIPIDYTAPTILGPDEGTINFIMTLDGHKYAVNIPYVELTTH
jgi:hypothetical protein